MVEDDTLLVEEAPLLDHIQDEASNIPPQSRYQVRSSRSAVFLFSFIIFCLALGGSLAIVPTTRLLEEILCHHYYKDRQDQDGNIGENLCKVGAIQSELAYLIGILSTLEAVIGLCVALPYGILADRLGRKPIFWLSMLGNALALAWSLITLRFWKSIPIRAILLSPALQVIGGGYNVISAVVFSMASDIESTENRGSAFFLITLAGHGANLLGPGASSFLMDISSPWIPLLLSFLIIPIAMSVLLFVPETLHITNHVNTPSPDGKPFISTVRLRLQSLIAETAESFSILKSPYVTVILLTNLVYMPTILSMGQFFVQYISKRFKLQLADTGYLLSIRGIISIFVLLVALPRLSKFLLLRTSAPEKDLILAKGSALSLTIGFLFLASSHYSIVIAGVIIVTFGDGLSPICRSLVTYFVDSHHTTRLYAIIGIVESIGSLYAGPTLAWLFTTGMNLKAAWLGIPYIWLALNATLVVIALYCVRLDAAFPETHMEGQARQSLVRDDEDI